LTQDDKNRNPDEPAKPGAPAPKKNFDDPAPAESSKPPAPAPAESPKKNLEEPPPAESSKLPDLPPRTFGKSKTKKDRSSFNLWGILIFFFLIVAGGVGAGGFYLYQEQIKFQEEARAKLVQLEDQIAALDTEADLTRKNQQSIDALKQELKQFKTQMNATVKAHQNSLTTLDEDVLRLKEKTKVPVPAAPAPTPETPEPLLGEFDPSAVPSPPETRDEDTGEETPESEDPEDAKTQKFLDWVDNFFGAIWNWFAGLFN